MNAFFFKYIKKMKKSLIITSCTNRKRKVRINGLSQLGEKLSLADIKTTTHNGLQRVCKKLG